MIDKEIIESLNKIYKESEDEHSIYTPLSLCRDMLSSISTFDDKNILVISNLEFLIVLKQMGINMDNVHYTVNCELKRNVAINLGIDENKIYNLEYKSKEVNLNTEMKFDVIAMNPPYNPNTLWKKFVEKAIDQLEDDGQMVAIHPDIWRRSSTHKTFREKIKNGASELHLTEFNSFPGVNVSTDWYLYNKNGTSDIKIYYPDNIVNIYKNDELSHILPFSKNSIENNIIEKITLKNYDNGLFLVKGWEKYILEDGTKIDLYNSHNPDGKYKQCGGKKNNTGWTIGNFTKIDYPSKYQYVDKIVMSHTRKLRAQYFSKDDNVGVLVGYILLTSNKNITTLFNSKMLWKIMCGIVGEKNMNNLPSFFMKTLNIENFNCSNEQEMYKHYNLTEEEITWIENN